MKIRSKNKFFERIECLLLPSIKLMVPESEESIKYTKVLKVIRKKISLQPLDLGNDDLKYGLDLYVDAIDILKKEGEISEEIENDLKNEMFESFESLEKHSRKDI